MRKRCSLLSAAVLAVLFMGPGAAPAAGEPPAAGDPLGPAEMAALEPGDFILRRGETLVSSLIAEVFGGETGFSHCGVIVPAEGADAEVHDGGGWRVIHSVSRALSGKDGLQEEPLAAFTRASVPGSTAVVRLRIPEDGRRELARQARRLLRRGAAFDHEFVLSPEGPLYCTELLWRLLPRAIRRETAVFQEPGQIVRFESFLNTEFFRFILDHRSRD